MTPGDTTGTSTHLQTFLDLGRHASMDWMETTAERRKSPFTLWPDVRSIILLGMNYGPDTDPMKSLALRDKATISVYARNRDYHDIIKGKLKELAGKVVAQGKRQDRVRDETEGRDETGPRDEKGARDVKVFVDTAPVMEKPLAQQAGLGWQGKHTNLVSKQFGSWLFLGSIFTSFALPSDEPESDHCGSCRKCLDICPTDAFPAPYQLDARRCISYLTIEHKGPIPLEFRVPMGNRIYGCDDCLAVCPWNKFAEQSREAKLHARQDLNAPALNSLATLDDTGFRQLFSGSPIKRIGRDRFIRNVLIAIGNSENETLVPAAQRHLTDPDPTIRATSVWALFRLLPPEAFRNLAADRQDAEPDPIVQQEWTSGLQCSN